jgi:large conductance mechanosensitive channel
MGLIKEFKEFASKGNIFDLAVAVVVGAAFSKIINSFIEDVITPLLLKPALDAAHLNDIRELTWGTVKYGSFLSNVINFLLVALVLFICIKAINKFKKKKEEAVVVVEPSVTEKLLTEIRDVLKNRS